MSFFQNVFATEFLGCLVLGDRQNMPTFKAKPNSGRGDGHVVSWNDGPYDLSGNDGEGDSKAILNINFAFDVNYRNWSLLAVNVTAGAGSASAVTSHEVVAALNASTVFAERFTASVSSSGGSAKVNITQRTDKQALKFYIANGQAETVLGFNARADVSELPAYFERHTIANRFVYEDSVGMLILLDPDNSVDAAVINGAVDYKGVSLGLDSTSPQGDWELLRGRSGIFNFQKITVDGDDRITQIIEYPAGARAGDFARKIDYTFTSDNKNPSEITETPYVLESGDLITPP